jgi:hypothetical protein
MVSLMWGRESVVRKARAAKKREEKREERRQQRAEGQHSEQQEERTRPTKGNNTNAHT